MKRGIKIFLVILSVLIILAIIGGVYIGSTVKQGLDLKESIEEIDADEIRNDIAEIQAGNCSKLEELEEDAEEIKEKVIEACKNPALKKVIESEQPGACEIANDPNSDAQKELDRLREYCEMS